MRDTAPTDRQEETSILLARQGGSEYVSEAAVLKKLYIRILPVGFFIVMFCYIDRGNLGFAANTFCADLKLSTSAYGFGAGLFYVGYATFQIPSNVILARLGAPTWLGIIMIFWGLVASGMAFVNSKAQFYFFRFALGFAESGTFPGLWYHVTVFFPERLQTLPLSILELALVLSQPVSSPVAVGLLSLDGFMGLAGWRWLFLMEGLFPIFLGIFVILCWPRDVSTANFLSPNEKSWLLSKVKAPAAVVPDNLRDIVAQVGSQLMEISTSMWYWVLVCLAWIRAVGMHVVLYFTTLIVHGFLDDYEVAPHAKDSDPETCSVSKSLGRKAVALSAVPYIVAMLSTYLVGWISQKRGERARLAGMTTMLSSAFFATFPIVAGLGLGWGFVAYCVGVVACHAPFPLLTSLTISHMPHHAKAAGLALFNTLAMLGGLAGPWVTGHMVDESKASDGISQYFGVALIVGSMMAFGGLILFFVPDPLIKKQNRRSEIEILEGSSVPAEESNRL